MLSRKASSQDKSTAGFTLLEILVVVIIAALLAAIAAPGWLAFMNRQRMNSVRSDLLETLRQVQADARQNRESKTVIIDPTDPIPTVRVGSTVADSDAFQLGNNNIKENYLQLSTEASTAGGWDTTITSVTFDYEGVVDRDDDVPFVISISPVGSDAQRCVVIANLLGSLKTLNGDACNQPTLD
ncbi:MAG: prepilin-type N-terminal cleavage/methylation domain-containing protein [Cyanobacteria bacterium P01_A01_bin.123]